LTIRLSGRLVPQPFDQLLDVGVLRGLLKGSQFLGGGIEAANQAVHSQDLAEKDDPILGFSIGLVRDAADRLAAFLLAQSGGGGDGGGGSSFHVWIPSRFPPITVSSCGTGGRKLAR